MTAHQRRAHHHYTSFLSQLQLLPEKENINTKGCKRERVRTFIGASVNSFVLFEYMHGDRLEEMKLE